jgi:Domain of unknown function (DUF4333)
MSLSVRKTALTVCCVAFALTGCSAKVSVTQEKTLSQQAVEQGITDALTQQVGRKPDSVACPGPLKAEVGQSLRCVLTGDGVKYGVAATVTSFDSATNKANFHVQVDNQPMPG